MSCVFCEIGTPNSELSLLPHNEHIIDTNSFYAIAGRGQICNGYAIICTRKHMYNTSLLEEKQLQELSTLKKVFRALSFNLYGCQPVFFEHGDANDCTRGGSCISHAHLHVLPMPLYRVPQILLNNSAVHFSDEVSAYRYMKKNSPYFLLELSNENIYVLKSRFLPCQFGRQLLCKELNLDSNWDWRTELDGDKMIHTINDYKSHLSTTLCNINQE